MSPPLVRHGWEIAFQPQLFALQVAELNAEVKRLKQELDPQTFVQHPQVKLLAAVIEGIKERIAAGLGHHDRLDVERRLLGHQALGISGP